MATQVHQIPRTMASIVMDLATTRQRIAVLNAAPDDDDGWDALTDRRDALQSEFEAVFYQTTGVSWALAEGVMGQ